MKILPKTSGFLLTLLAALALTANLPAKAQNLFEGDWSIWNNNNIYQFTPGGAKTIFASVLNQAVGLAFDSSSNLFVASGYYGTITKITPDGTQSTFASGLSYPFGLAFNIVGDLFEADLGSGNIYRFTPDGVRSTFASGLNRPCALAVDSAGNLFEADQGSGSVYKFTPDGAQSPFASGGAYDINGLALNSTGYLFVARESSGKIYKFAPDGSQSIFASGLKNPSGLAIDDAGNVFVGNEGDGTIYKFTPDGTPSIFATGLNAPNGLAFQRSPGTLTPRVLHVPADYPTIQWAINAASYFVADTVLVTNGIYYENLDFGGKAVTVTSVNGPQVTIIDGSAAGSVVNFSNGENTNSRISGFKLTNGTSGVNASGLAPTISSNIIVNCGTGIACYSGSPVIVNNLISNSAGSAIYFFDTSTPLLAGNVLMSNQGGGVNMYVAGSPTIINNLIQDNIGDGITMMGGSDANIVQNVILGNSGYGIDALIPASNRGPFIINNTIANNTNAGIYENGFPSSSQIINNIVVGTPAIAMSPWYNLPPAVIQFNDFYSPDGGVVYNGDVITNLTGLDGNFSAAPWFNCQPEGDFHLLAGSTCIDAGTNSAPYLPSSDYDNNPRVLVGNSNNAAVVDLGAYEFNPLYPPVPCMFINCQTDMVVHTGVGQNSAVVNFPTPTGTPSAAVTCSPPSGSTFFGGTNVVTCTATYGTNSASCSFNVIVIVAPTITRQPNNLQVAAGQNFTLSVDVSGTPPIYYQWSYQGNPIDGANAATLILTNAQSVNEGIYSVLVYNDAGSTNSSFVRVRVLPVKPVIVTNPDSTTVAASAMALFNVVAVGSEPMAYQWYFNQQSIRGATSSQLWVTNAQTSRAGTYHVIVSNFKGSTTSKTAKLKVLPSPPAFVAQPESVTLVYGSKWVLSSQALGSEPMRYQWHFKGRPLQSKIGMQLTLPSVTSASAGDYYVIATNIYGRATSTVAQVTVNVPPRPARLLNNQVVRTGQKVVLSFAARGDAPLTYSWQLNGSPISYTNPVLVITNIQIKQAGYYQVTASNAFGSYSSIAKVSILGPSSRLVAWGDNTDGQAHVPASLNNVVAVAGGDFHSIAVRASGKLVAWGDNSDGQVTIPSHLPMIVAIASGASHNLAVGKNGSIFAWGNNTFGQCNIPAFATNQPMFVSAGNAHSLALLANGTVAVWGDNTYGQTSLPDILTPGYYLFDWWTGQSIWIPNPNWVPARAIVGGRIHNLAVLTNGIVVGWGDNSFGQLNIPSGLTNATAVAGGSLHSVALCADGTVVVWGDDTYGQTEVPTGLTNVVAIATGDFHTLALLADGTVKGWGDDLYGQIDIPGTVTNAVNIASGYYHGIALVPSLHR